MWRGTIIGVARSDELRPILRQLLRKHLFRSGEDLLVELRVLKDIRKLSAMSSVEKVQGRTECGWMEGEQIAIDRVGRQVVGDEIHRANDQVFAEDLRGNRPVIAALLGCSQLARIGRLHKVRQAQRVEEITQHFVLKNGLVHTQFGRGQDEGKQIAFLVLIANQNAAIGTGGWHQTMEQAV